MPREACKHQLTILGLFADERNRHFAQIEITALVSLFVAGFEIEDGKSGGTYVPPLFNKNIRVGVSRSAYDMEVKLRKRNGYERVEWKFEM